MNGTAVPAPATESWASNRAEYDWYAAQYWQMRRHREGYKAPLTTGQHILHLLLTVFTAGLWLPVWIIRAAQGNKVPGDPAAPMPEWPPLPSPGSARLSGVCQRPL